MKQDNNNNLKKNFHQGGVLGSLSNHPFYPSEGGTDTDKYQSNFIEFKEEYNPTLPENLITKSSNMPEFQNELENSIFEDTNFDQKQDMINPSHHNNFDDQVHVHPREIQQTGESLFNLAISLFRKKVSNNEIYIEAYHLKEIFIEIFEALDIHIKHTEIHQLINLISDFIPKKIIEQGFIDLFNFPQVTDFFVKHHVIEASETARFTGNHLNIQEEHEEIVDPNISLESLSFVVFSSLFIKFVRSNLTIEQTKQ